MILTEEQRQLYERLEAIFFAYAKSRYDHFRENDLRLAHYTTAESAIKIVQSKTFWMREVRSMSDFREVEHGYGLLLEYFQIREKKDAFCAALDQYFPDTGVAVLKRFDDWWAHIRSSTYICCFSEHGGKIDEAYGRLSMWRAYGSKSGVALTFKVPAPYSAPALGVFLSPVAYLEKDDFWNSLDTTVARVQGSREMLVDLPRDVLIHNAYRMLVMAVLSLKHPAFLEEREWRIIYLPFEAPSKYVTSETVILGGIPQIIHKMKLENIPDDGIVGITLPELLDRVLIGPTQYPGPIYASLAKELAAAGITDTASKMAFSGIPLRT